MRIAFIVNNFPPRAGGVEFHVQALARELAAQGHVPIVITLAGAPGRRTDGDVEVMELREHFRVADTLGFPGPGTRRALTRLLRAQRIDVVSVHTRFFPMTFVGLRAAAAAGIPVVHTEHGSDHVVTDSAVIRIASRLVDHTIGRWVLRHADRVLGVSEAVTAFVRRLAGVDADIFYNAIEAPPSPPSKHPQNTSRAVFVGRLVPGKGWDAFLEALAAVHSTGTPITCDLVGDGPEMPRVRALVRELGIAPFVTIHGRLPQQKVRALLRGATLVNPTVLAEGFQTTLLEAVAEGGRVVTYAVPGAQRLRDEGAPVLITESNSVATLTALLRAEIGQGWSPASADAIDAWTWPTRARQFAEVCASLDAVISRARG